MEHLKKLLHGECNYRMKDETMDAFIGLMSEMELKNNEPLIPYGKFDDNIYILKEGILRYAYFQGLKEMTFGFAIPGTVTIQYHSFYNREPSFFQIESCGKSTVMKVTRADFDRLAKSSDDFTNWMFRL
jgi:CRP-like cAMP-binding protein